MTKKTGIQLRTGYEANALFFLNKKQPENQD